MFSGAQETFGHDAAEGRDDLGFRELDLDLIEPGLSDGQVRGGGRKIGLGLVQLVLGRDVFL
ncbi:MAG: hypothetical protein PVG57_06990, partial [Gammaproteobacteria bacterium]